LGYYTADILVWITISLLISILIVGLTLPYFNTLFQIKLRLNELLDIRFFAIGLSVILFILLATLLPYVAILSKFNVLLFLKGRTESPGKNKIGSILTVLQLTISILLISGLLIVERQIGYLKFRDLGFIDDKLMYIELQYNKEGYNAFKTELLKNPSITKATLSNGIPGSICSKRINDKWMNSYFMMDIDEEFISTMGMELKEGRNLTRADVSTKGYIVNEATIAAMEMDNIDKNTLEIGEIVGVVKNFNFESLHQNIQPLIMKYGDGRQLSLRLSTNNLPEVMDCINKVWAKFYPDEPMQYNFYDTWFDSMYKKEEQLGYASIVFSFIAIVITCLGLLGKIIQTSLLRTKEIGVRKVNGASVSEVLVLLNRDFIKWVAIAFVIAAPIAYYAMHKWLENFAYKTSLSWWIFALAGLLALGIALLTVSWQSWRAATRNPVEALRYE